ncbi:MAG: hypothetical protein MI757_15450, partial [Pirellulales bacterium]|nr:hypothetical protein [Pirellulales bacterium]
MSDVRITLAAAVALIFVGRVDAQFFGPQTTLETRSHNISDSFYERIGVDFDFDIGGFKFRQGSFDAAIPSVGGFTGDQAGATFGFSSRKGKNRSRLRFALGQGSTRTHSMEAPVLTVANGRQGFVTNTTQIPFVTNVIPVVNNWRGPINAVPPNFAAMPGFGQPPVTSVTPYYGNATAGLESRMRAAALAASREEDYPRRSRPKQPQQANLNVDKHSQRLYEARGSSAGQPAPSVASILASQAEADTASQDEAMSFFERGLDAEERGKTGVAKIYYRNA